MFFDVEDAIVDRLTAKLAAVTPKPRVFSSVDLEGIKDRSQHAAAVYVAYNGITNISPLQQAPQVVTVQQEFIIWTVTRSASRVASGEGIREAADPIMVAILDALCGWRPAQGLPPLELDGTTGPAYDEGFGYFPLSFKLKRQIRGNPN